MDNPFNEDSNEEIEVKKTITSFYEAFYQSDRIKMFSYLSTSFQKSVPLNYFLIHSDFDIDVGILIDIRRVRIDEEKKRAFVECYVDFQRGKKEVVIVLILEEVWKIDAKSIFRRKF